MVLISTAIGYCIRNQSVCQSNIAHALFNRINKNRGGGSRAGNSDCRLNVFAQVLHRAYFTSGSIIVTPDFNGERVLVNNGHNANRIAIVRFAVGDQLYFSYQMSLNGLSLRKLVVT